MEARYERREKELIAEMGGKDKNIQEALAQVDVAVLLDELLLVHWGAVCFVLHEMHAEWFCLLSA